MNGKFHLLNVGDGDAIIVLLQRGIESLIIVIDGGESRHYESKVKPLLKNLLRATGKIAPDIVVVTHYDSDHIAGLIPLIDDYIDGIQEVWVHRSPELSDGSSTSFKSGFLSGRKLLTAEFLSETKQNLSNLIITEEEILLKSRFVIESLGQLETLLGKIPSAKVKHVYYGYTFPGWPELKVLGPTEEFYDQLFPRTKTLMELIVDEVASSTFEDDDSLQRIREIAFHGLNPCQRLKTEANAKLTQTNKASIIISIDINDKRCLFTGDAGITSFKAIPNWKQELKNLYWLKIPHHSSDNNMSTEIINVMQPKYADSSGDRHQDDHVIECISTNQRSMGAPRSTKTNGDLIVKVN